MARRESVTWSPCRRCAGAANGAAARASAGDMKRRRASDGPFRKGCGRVEGRGRREGPGAAARSLLGVYP